MNADLLSRIVPAILYVVFIAGLTLLGTYTTLFMLVVFFSLSLFELVSSYKIIKKEKSIIYFIPSILVVFTLFSKDIGDVILLPLTMITCTLFVLNLFWFLVKKENVISNFPSHLLPVLYIAFPFAIAIGMTLSVELFPKILLGTFIILWLNDAGAYFIGKAIGKTKLAPSISPNKTWEGSIGGAVVGLGIAYVVALFIGGLATQEWLSLSLAIWIFGASGDLVESSWKRTIKIKDSGTLMGGHGGILDRLDSFTYSVPFVSLIIILIF